MYFFIQLTGLMEPFKVPGNTLSVKEQRDKALPCPQEANILVGEDRQQTYK